MLFQKRINQLIIAIVIILAILLFEFSWINLIIGAIIVIVVYKNQYSSLKGYYKKHLTEIDQTLPYYLKTFVYL